MLYFISIWIFSAKTTGYKNVELRGHSRYPLRSSILNQYFWKKKKLKKLTFFKCSLLFGIRLWTAFDEQPQRSTKEMHMRKMEMEKPEEG